MASKNLIRIDKLPPALQEKIKQHAFIGVHVDEEKKRIIAESADIEKYVQQWIDTKHSVCTREAYRREIEKFLSFLHDLGIHPALCTAESVDAYMIELSKVYGKNSIRHKMSVCSSFFSTLKRYKVIPSNPFRGSPLPRRKYKHSDSPVMNEEELQMILLELGRMSRKEGTEIHIINIRESAKRISSVVYFLYRYGLRVGSIQSIELKDGFFTAIEKGNNFRRIPYAQDDDFQGVEMKPFAGPGYKSTTIKHAISRITKRLHKAGEIRRPYSCHDFRHYFAAKLYRETKDILQVKEALGHASIAITDTYLQGLGLIPRK